MEFSRKTSSSRVAFSKTEHSGDISSGGTSIVIISRVVLFVCLVVLIFLGYRLWIVREIDKTYRCVENTIAEVERLNSLMDSSEGLLVEEAETVFQSADDIEENLARASSCLSTVVPGRDAQMYAKCSNVGMKALTYVGNVKEAARLAAEDNDAYDLQELVDEAYAEYLVAVSECDSLVEQELNNVVLDL